jgi:hypothetical protein
MYIVGGHDRALANAGSRVSKNRHLQLTPRGPVVTGELVLDLAKLSSG